MIHVVEFHARAHLVFVGNVQKQFDELDNGAQGIRLHEFHHVRGCAESAAVEEERVVFVQRTTSGIRQAQLGEFPLFRERQCELRVAQRFFH